ncbi:MAG: STAS domain-containing protein [Streptosporangiaceae bacterium]
MTAEIEGGERQVEDLLVAHREAVLDRWVALGLERLGNRVTQAELRGELQEILTTLIGALGSGPQGAGLSELKALLAELSRSRARQGYSPSETAVVVYLLKEVVYEIMEKTGTAETFPGFIAFSRIIDDLGLFTFETYAIAREKVITDQTEQLLELSTPVVKLWEGILAVPLVGTLDSARTQVVMEKLLQGLVDTGSQHAVIDITGVPAVDTEVAQHLLKTVVAARLMGAECIVSGIRPQIAQTIVALGIEFGDITTKATLADALVHALRQLGVDVSSTAAR